MTKQQRVQIELTEEQKQKIKVATGRDAQTVELTLEELEDRIAPVTRGIIING